MMLNFNRTKDKDKDREIVRWTCGQHWAEVLNLFFLLGTTLTKDLGLKFNVFLLAMLLVAQHFTPVSHWVAQFQTSVASRLANLFSSRLSNLICLDRRHPYLRSRFKLKWRLFSFLFLRLSTLSNCITWCFESSTFFVFLLHLHFHCYCNLHKILL